MEPQGRIETVVEGTLRGWAWDPAQPTARLPCLLSIDGVVVATPEASLPRGDLQRRGIGDGGHGLEVALPPEVQDGALHDITLAVSTPAGAVVVQSVSREIPARAAAFQGKVERILDNQLFGWVWDRGRPARLVAVELLHEERVLAVGIADRYRGDLMRAGIGRGAHGFVFALDELRPPPPPGAVLQVRTSAELGHWRVGTIAAPGGLAASPPAPPPRATAAMPATGSAPAAAAPRTRTLLAEARQAEAARDFGTAARLLDEALGIASGDFDLLFTRARVAIALQDFETGERLAQRALAIRPGHVRPTVLLARIASAEIRHEDAVALWAQVPFDDPAGRERSVKRARSLLALGRAMEALAEHAETARRDPTDREALRAMAELAEAAGGRRAALRHWRRYLAIAADEAAARHVDNLARELAPPERSTSPLRNPWLRGWPEGVEGVAGAEPVEPAEGLRLRSLGEGGASLAWAAGAARERRPGELPFYGLWLRAEGAGAEAVFELDAAAAPRLAEGLRLSMELQALGLAPGAALALEIGLAPAGAAAGWQGLCRLDLGPRPRLARFELRLAASEVAGPGGAAAWLGVRLAGPGTLLLLPPQPVAALPAPARARTAPEQQGLQGQLAALRRNRPAPAAGQLAPSW